ncbi:hypothetical protein [Bradyrhizobium sp. Tv2a-2]|uniref:hypothetical protein n=1 Tax=Bradyrhizobium sp. Tv2a-2 TaxID=113395 RepID=UPI000464FA7F|nr:hypothetical protein [Bradyrhizobium sp. Tv2a-2]
MTSLANPLNISRFLQVFDNDAAQAGIKILIGFDFHEYVSITRATPTKQPTYPNFRPDRSPIRPGEGYWIIGIDTHEDVVVLSAARLYDLSHSNFAEHLESLKAFYADPALHAHPQDRCACIAPSARKIAGKVAYHGDYWVRQDFRGRGLSKITSPIMQGTSFAMWAPDFLCGLVPRWSLDSGLVAEYGYAHHERGGAKLYLVDEDTADDWLIWRTGAELRAQFGCHDRSEPLLASSFSPAGAGDS